MPSVLPSTTGVILLAGLFAGGGLFYSLLPAPPSGRGAPDTMLRYSEVAGRPYTVTYDSRAFKINGERTLLLGGSIHYPRLAVEEWDPMLEEMAQDGLNHLQLYVFWNFHEPEPPRFDDVDRRFVHNYDFSGRADLVRFIRAAGEKDLFVNLRIGPYVCAEWAFGGLPLWLRDVPGMCFRSICGYDGSPGECKPWEDGDFSGCDPWREYMADFVMAIGRLVKDAKLTAAQGGPVIMAQLENEYGDDTEAGRAYIDWVGELSFGLGLDVPWVMCNGMSANGTINVYNGDDGAEEYKARHDERWPDEPLGWTENEGWFDTWAGSFENSQRSAEEMAYVVARWVAVGGSHHNYYMWYGGNHVGQWGAASLTNAYADGVNFRADGLPNEPKRSHLRRLNVVLGELNGELMEVEDRHTVRPVKLEHDAEVFEWTSRLAFLHRPACGEGGAEKVSYKQATYTIKCREVLVVDPSTAIVRFASASVGQPPELITKVLANLTMEQWSMRREIARHGMAVVNATKPIDHLSISDLDTDYVTYKTTVATDGANGNVSLEIDSRVSQVFHVSTDGGSILTATVMNLEKGNTQWKATVPLPGLESNRSYDLWILSESLGVENGMLSGAPAKTEPSLQKGIVGDVRLNNQSIKEGDWSMVKGLDGEVNNSLMTSDTPCCNSLGPAWFMAGFTIDSVGSPGTRSISLTLPQGLPDQAGGHIWLNGVNIGRWRAVGYRQATYRLPPGVLVSGENTLAIFSATGHWVTAQGSPPAVVEKFYRREEVLSTEVGQFSPDQHPSLAWCSSASTPQGGQGRDSRGTAGRQTRRSPSSFVRRSPEEMKRLVASWDHYVSSRARDFFVTREKLEEVLMMIAKSIHHTEDPILGDDNCVFWYGEVTKDDNQAVIRMVKPTEDSESLTYVNRVMVLIFSSDEAFQHLMTLPKAPFRMACGNQLCVSLHHVALN
ncbi:Beta-galactosidase 6 [Perkinsus olseni]|uniref:Beta-galactosidase n=1 Tax=Perkinsus olseni TaxID=32597 RepID=A0A7J6LVD1_PEROL|nr:Beta-galactosidase 6 [Perkinsus olseni]